MEEIRRNDAYEPLRERQNAEAQPEPKALKVETTKVARKRPSKALVRSLLSEIEEVLYWDFGFAHSEEQEYFNKAQEAMKKLKKLFR